MLLYQLSTCDRLTISLDLADVNVFTKLFALQYMVERLRQLKGRVVGVVGLAHLDGMERLWEQGNYQTIKIGS